MSFKSHFKFNKQERSGIFYLLLLIALIQIGYFTWQSSPNDNKRNAFVLNADVQEKVDLLKKEALHKDSVQLYPFNPNFITDYKGYTIGMSVQEIDRLHAYRALDKYVNSAEDFQKVTKVSDSLLGSISSFFKFPEWTKQKRIPKKTTNVGSAVKSKPSSLSVSEIQDLNTATEEQLMMVNGVGEVLSKRIVKYRNRLGGFVVKDQLYEVYFLEPEVADRVLAKFKLFNTPPIKKININDATAYEISAIVYIKYALAKEIVAFREKNGAFSSLNELLNIADFPADKIDIIALYLSV